MNKAQLAEKIKELPKGGISYKTINGKQYAYYQWRENGKQHSRVVKDPELSLLSSQIQLRKQLETQLQAPVLNNFEMREDVVPYNAVSSKSSTNMRLGLHLRKFAEPVRNWKKRLCFEKISNYIYGNTTDKVLILYGLRRTGKTTLIRQLLLEMSDEDLTRTAFIQVCAGNTLSGLNDDLKKLEISGYRYIFIDEVTLLEDFIQGAALFSDVFATSGMKIVLSGTDSLGFRFTEDEQLYDRCFFVHTTFIPYREFEEVLNRHGVDEYIKFGGTMSMGGIDYNSTNGIFSSAKKTTEYVDSAIARNIQHSLKHYEHEGHFRHLRELYEANELTNVINRVVEDINHRFTLNVLTKSFKSNDLALSANNLRKTDLAVPLDNVNPDEVITRLMELLEIKNREQLSIDITEIHAREIKEYLDLLDLTFDVELRTTSDYNAVEYRTVFTQPGLRYTQARALIYALLQNDIFRQYSAKQRKFIQDRILNEIKGRMFEDLILLETKLAHPESDVFKLQFPIGEFDMVVANPDESTCRIYEIKHSDKAVIAQAHHLQDIKKCSETEYRYGHIISKSVIYSGQTIILDGICYKNIEEYLRELVSSPNA